MTLQRAQTAPPAWTLAWMAAGVAPAVVFVLVERQLAARGGEVDFESRRGEVVALGENLSDAGCRGRR
jgi:hypothetical protein